MSTGMRYKSKLVNPGEAAGTRGRSAPRPGASLSPHSLSFSLPAAGPRRGHPALAAPPRRGEAGRWAPAGHGSPRGCGSYLGTAAAWLHSSGKRALCLPHPPGFWLGFLFCRCLWVCRAGSDGERQRGAGRGVWVLGARLPSVCPPQHRCADTAPVLPLLGAAADRHLAGGQDLGVREHLFCFAKLIAIWRYAFESWRERRGDAIR